MTYILAILAFLCIASPLVAQDDAAADSAREAVHPNLRAVARSYGDSIVLRWGTTTHTAWKVAGSKGYMIQRYELHTHTAQQPAPVMLTASPIVPLTIDEWKARYRPEDTLAGAAVQAWYGKAVVTSTDPFGAIYETYLQQTNMFGFALLLADLAPRIADGLGLRFVDRTADHRHTYLYRIYSLADNPDEPIDTATVIISASDIGATPSIESLTASEGEMEVVLKWDRLEHATPFTGYFVERSTDGGRTFARLSNLPFIPADNPSVPSENSNELSYRVKLAADYQPVQYRVVGVDAFGESSPASKVITAMGRDRTAPEQARILPPEVDGRSLKVSWELDSIDADLAGFYVAKSLDVDGPFERIGPMLPKDARTFADKDVNDLPQHYYVVQTVDTAGNERSSAPVLGMFPDSIAPATPVALGGSIDSNGIVTLHWNADSESDLKGYRVFYANQPDHEFQQLTTDITADTVFTDTLTLETLSEEIYYKVTALDQNFNHSPFTAMLTLRKPDVVAPAAPLVVDVAAAQQGVILALRASPSADVVEHTLYRRVAGEEAWQALWHGDARASASFTDSSALEGTLYEYALEALDDAGHRSPMSNIVSGTRLVAGVSAPVYGVTPVVDRSRNGIVLRWNGSASSGARIYLYRASNAGELALYRSLDAGATEFVDDEISAGTTYRYGVKTVTDRGAESRMVTTEAVKYE